MRKIKSSKLSISEINTGKKEKLIEFISEYRKAVKFYIDYLWNNEIIYKDKVFNIKKDLLDCPQFISIVGLDAKTNLFARSRGAAATQACGLVSKAVEYRRRLLFIHNKLKLAKEDTRSIGKKLKKEILIKPKADNIYPELNSLYVKIEKSSIKHFDYIITLKSLGESYGKIVLLAKGNKHLNKLLSIKDAKLMTSILLSQNTIDFRVEYNTENKEYGKIVGADSGINSVLTFSDSQQTIVDIHNHTLNSILKKISRKKKGSKAFHAALQHRDNFINWSVKQLNLENIKEIRLEKVSNFRHKKNVGKFLYYSGEALIRSRLIDYAEDNGVRVTLQSSAYRSQRCSCCGFVSKKNRKGKLFCCKHCFFQADADLNASLNHEIELPSANVLRYRSEKIGEFYWKAKGFFDLNGEEIIVSCLKK